MKVYAEKLARYCQDMAMGEQAFSATISGMIVF
jgi:hypothetical protein